MAASGDAGDDFVADPAFHPVSVQGLAVDAEPDDDPDVGDVASGDADEPG
ncbi:hypothetical protein AB4089_22750 [Arthrobacter sp. 2MCAF15]